MNILTQSILLEKKHEAKQAVSKSLSLVFGRKLTKKLAEANNSKLRELIKQKRKNRDEEAYLPSKLANFVENNVAKSDLIGMLLLNKAYHHKLITSLFAYRRN